MTSDRPDTDVARASRRASCGAPPPPPTRSRAPSPRAAARRRSGTPSPTRPAGSRTATPATWPTTTTTGSATTSRSWPTSASPPTGSRWPGRGSPRTSRPTRSARSTPRARLLLRPGRRAARRRDHARGHPLPLGPAAGPGGRGRLDRAGHRRAVRRVRRGRRRRARRPGAAVHHAQRAVVQRLPGLRQRRARAGPHRRGAALTAVHHLNLAHGLARARRSGAAAPAAQVGVTLNLAWVRPETDSAARRSTPPAASTACRTGCSSTRCCTAATPPTSLADTAGGHRLVVRPARRPGGDRGAARRAGRELLQPHRTCGTGRASGPRETADGHGDSAATPVDRLRRRRVPAPARPARPTWAGASTPAG